MQFLGFLFFPGSEDALDKQGGKVKHLLIAYFLSNNSTKIIEIGSRFKS